MSFEEGLRKVSDIFESKIVIMQEKYKMAHLLDFKKKNMDDYVNRKLSKEINALIGLNIFIPISTIFNS